MQAHILNPVD